ncbi:MAG: hypothetical protein R3B96_19440 [Pirellulaceae bacterium]
MKSTGPAASRRNDYYANLADVHLAEYYLRGTRSIPSPWIDTGCCKPSMSRNAGS